jgi:predicted MFS family arabinose efflux permease
MEGPGLSYRPEAAGGQGRGDAWQFRLIFAVTFLVMLVATALSRLSFPPRREGAGRGHLSILQEARARTDRIVPFVFMG